jgi:hypothetical protein
MIPVDPPLLRICTHNIPPTILRILREREVQELFTHHMSRIIWRSFIPAIAKSVHLNVPLGSVPGTSKREVDASNS